jgi:hypothetical protein
MKKGSILVTVLILVSMSTADSITEIRNYYNEVKDALESGNSSLYETELLINTGDMSYPALGKYTEKITFHWGCEAGESWLVLVTWECEYAAIDICGEALYTTHDQFVMNSEEVVFQFQSTGMGGETMYEERWWFDDGELIQSSGESFVSGIPEEYAPNDGADTNEERNHRSLLELFWTIHN